MPKTLMLALALLLSAAWLQAQDQYPQTGSSQTGTAASGQNAVQGCLQGSNGKFTLTDNSGTTYQLQGDTSKLTQHVGHEVQITGSTSGARSASPSSTMSPGGTQGSQQPTIMVEKVKHISKTCKATSK